MTDRADYLARLLAVRLANLQERFAEERRGEPDRWQRIEALEKVLAVEIGLIDAATLSLIEASAPNLPATGSGSARELAEFAEFLRRRLGAQLTEK